MYEPDTGNCLFSVQRLYFGTYSKFLAPCSQICSESESKSGST